MRGHVRFQMVPVVGAALALLLAGCTAPKDEQPVEPDVPEQVDLLPQPPAEFEFGEMRTADGSIVEPTLIELSSAGPASEGSDYTTLFETPMTTGDDRYVSVLDLTSSGAMVVGVVPSDNYEGGEWLLKDSQIGLSTGGDVTTWRSTQDVFADDHPRQTYAASEDGGVTAWAETASTRLSPSNWRLFVRDLEGTTSLLARSEDVFDGELPVIGEDTFPVLAGDRVYWSTAVAIDEPPTVGPAFASQVMSRPVDLSEPSRVEVRGAGQPAAGDGGLFVVRSSLTDPSLPEGELTIEKAKGDGNSEVFLSYAGSPGTHFSGLATSANRVAFVLTSPTESGGRVVIIDVQSGAVTQLALAGSGRGTTLAMCGDRLVWTSADGSGLIADEPVYVLDAASADLASVEVPGNYWSVWCAGDLVAWQTIDESPGALARTTVAQWGPDTLT